MTFGSMLKEIRINYAMIGLRRFANLINMKPSQYCDIEHNRCKPPSTDKIESICDTLGLYKDDKQRDELIRLSKSYKPSKRRKLGFPIFAHDTDGKLITGKKLEDLTNFINNQ